MNQIKIMSCVCKNSYQDRVYGSGQRVHNKRNSKSDEFTCTVCGKINKTASSIIKKVESK